MIPTTLSREQFYTEYRDTVLAYISARVSSYEDAQDLCQEVFIKFFRALERFDGSRASVSTLIYKITHDIVVDHHRTFHTYTSLDETEESVPSTEDIYVENEKYILLRDSLKELPEQQRDILIMRFYAGLSLSEIAERTGLSYHMTVKKQREAFAALREKLRGKF